ncbi:hypothetical protein IJJ49_00905, partial [Candidatus Saccharibacteria bacterium]|nr:hypothetical protein [Candidatus Saccharibacteria bacterium]
AATKLPVTKNLQTAPTIPSETDDEASETESKEELDENLGEEETGEEAEGSASEIAAKTEAGEENEEAEDADNSENEEKTTKKDKKAKKERKKSENKVVAWIQEHKKLATIGGIGGLVLILILVWAFAIAPAVTVTVGIRTTANNFSESVSFTTKLEEEDAETGKFYLEEKKISEDTEVEFTATGKKNVGEKAKGEVVIYAYFPLTGGGGKIAINAGSTFSISGLSYASDSDASISWDGDLGSLSKDCENYDNFASMRNSGCLVSKRVAVTATESGEKYNISASQSGWSTVASVSGVYSDKAMSGGTDEFVTIVTKDDVEKARADIEVGNESENKTKLFEKIEEESETAFIVESSFAQTVSEAKSTPAVGEEVKDGVTPKISVTTTATVFVIDKTKVEEFIREKAKISDSQKIYEIRDPFIENFLKTDSGYTGKLKTSYVAGPKVTENDIIEIIKGKGLGEAQHDLRDIDGISSMRIDTSYPWVMSIPGDPNKITVILNVEE